MTSIRRASRAPLRTVQLVLAAALAFGALCSAGAASATTDDSGAGLTQNGYGLTVTVTSPTPAPSSTPPRPPGGTPQRTTTTVDTAKTTTPLATVPTSNQVSLGGKLFLDGVQSSYQPSVNPFDGTVNIEFTVKNVSNETVDAAARFWATGPFGNDLGSVEAVPVEKLAPGESRIVSAELPGVGQWVFVNAGYTFTPPETIDGVATTPITRTAALLIFPWAVAVLALLGVSVVVAARFLLTRERVNVAPVTV
ncbi:hypothetical protein AB4Y63_03040 [Leifsonia sp. YAF41]|uniref:hypothetical protein n=1 Tax=Leifsonia sp. YAF41 TaxID=3233086 RepID=UPI003F9E2D4F